MQPSLNAWCGSHAVRMTRDHMPNGAAEATQSAPRTETTGRALRDVLVTNYETLSRRLALRFGCADLASDCLHDAWLRLGNLTLSPAIQSPEAYIFRVACNLAFDRLRGLRPGQFAEDADVDLEHLADAAPDLEEVAAARSDLNAVTIAFQCLPPRHQAVLLAVRIEEQTRDEVAARLRLSLRNVDTTLRQALQHCAAPIDRPIIAGSSRPRRDLPLRWRKQVSATGSRSMFHVVDQDGLETSVAHATTRKNVCNVDHVLHRCRTPTPQTI